MIKITLNTGKEIEVTGQEFEELKGLMQQSIVVPYPLPSFGWPSLPSPPYKVGDFPPFDGEFLGTPAEHGRGILTTEEVVCGKDR